MAQNTESSGTGLRPYRSPYGFMPIRGYQQTTNSTFVAGHLVELNTATNAHRITTASSNSTQFLGVAAEAASSDAASGAQAGQRMIPVYEARPEVEFLGWLKEAIASTLVGQMRGLHRDSTRNIEVLGRSTGSLRVEITEVGSDSNQSATQQLASIGDTNGYVAFRLLPEYTRWNKRQPIYDVEYTPPALAANSAERVALSSHADFTTNAVYVFSFATASPSTRYVVGPVYCSTATELRAMFANPGASTMGTGESTQRGRVIMFNN